MRSKQDSHNESFSRTNSARKSGKLVTMDYQNIFDLMDQHFKQHQEDRKIPGIAYGLIKDGQLVHAKGFGHTVLDSNTNPDQSSVFRIAPMTKSFTATAILLHHRLPIERKAEA